MPSPSVRLWLGFATFAFVAYVVLVLTASGDSALLWIVGFVIVGWPTTVIGVIAAIVMARRGRDASSPSFGTVVSLSLLAFGGAALALQLGTSTEYVPAALLWIAAPTLLSAVSLFATRTPHPHLT